MTVMDCFNGLFEADGDEKADDDGGDVDEESRAMCWRRGGRGGRRAWGWGAPVLA
jgi:hypothetical protein